MDEETQERIKLAAELRSKLDSGDKKGYDSDYPTVEIARIWKSIMEYLGDDTNEALTQLDKKGWKNPFLDETESFATAIHFSEHPFDDIEMEFERRGIRRKLHTPIKTTDGNVITHVPIKFQVIPLRTFAKEWMKRRHPVNRQRVKELIELVTGSRLGENFGRQSNQSDQTTINNSNQKRMI